MVFKFGSGFSRRLILLSQDSEETVAASCTISLTASWRLLCLGGVQLNILLCKCLVLRVLLFTLTPHRRVREGGQDVGPQHFVIIGPVECLLSLLTDGDVRQAYLPK